MAENLSLPNLLTRILVDNAQVKKKMAETNALMAQNMTQMGKKVQTFTTKSTKNMNRMTESWWKKFGTIALGFTIAYRAINAFEAGVRRMSQTIKAAIKESGELVSLQAKLAFYYQSYSKTVISFADAYDKAAVNVRELSKESLKSLSSLEELAIGYDEVAQSVGGLGKASIKNLAALIDFTVMVAQTTGSTTRQIRQEIQSLLQGQVRTTDVAIRTMKRMGILTAENISDLKSMINVNEILNKVLGEIYERTKAMREVVVRSNVEIAIKKWDDAIKFLIRDAVEMTSKMEGVRNIFAEVFFQRKEGLIESLGLDDWKHLIRLMQVVRNVLDFLAGAFLTVLLSLGQLAVKLESATKKIKDMIPWLKRVAVAILLWKSFQIMTGIIKFLGGAIIVKAIKNLILLGKALAGVGAASLVVVTRLGFVVTMLAALIIPVLALINGFKKFLALMDSFADNLEQIQAMRSFEGPPSFTVWLKEMASAMRLASKEIIKGKGMFGLIKETFGDALSQIGGAAKSILKSMLDPIKDLFKDITGITDEQMIALLIALEKWGEGLGMPGGKGALDPEAIKKYDEDIKKLTTDFLVFDKTLSALKAGELDWQDALDISEFKDLIKIEEEFQDLLLTVGVVNANMWRDTSELTLEAENALKKYFLTQQLSYDLTEKMSELTVSFRQHEINALNREIKARQILAGGKTAALEEIEAYRVARMAEIAKEFSGLADLARDVAGEMESAFSDLFFDVMTLNFEDLGDLAERTFQAMQRALADYLALQLRLSLIGEEGSGGKFSGGWLQKFFNWGGGGNEYATPEPWMEMHKGGRVGYWGGVNSALTSFAPRLHEGLKSDEMFAILQRGERVYKRGDMPFDKVEIHNYTPFEAKSEEKDTPGGGRAIAVIVGEMMGNDVLQGGPLHNAMRKRFGLNPSVRGR